MRRALYVLPLCLAACRPSADPQARASTGSEPAPSTRPPAAAPARPDGRFLGFAAYPNVRPLCAEHVAGAPPPGGAPPLHITWASFESKDAPGVVLAFYARPGAADAGFSDARLGVYPAHAPPPDGGAPYPRCDTKASADAKTVIVVSRTTGGGTAP